jgi:nicotinate-nucleotide adenylyltransferase
LRQKIVDEVLFVPASRPPHKRLHASFEDRYRMIELALDGEPDMVASRLEADLMPSYSIDTIEKLKPQLSPDDRLFFLIGADAFAEIQTWKRWRDVANAVEFIVVSRPGHRYKVPEGVRVHRLDILDLTVSSSGIRQRLAADDDRVDAPPAVLRYIVERNLYSPQM